MQIGLILFKLFCPPTTALFSSSSRDLGYFASLGQNTPKMPDSDLPDHSSTSMQR